MTSAWDSLPHPTVIAHRGASRYAPENTLAAFRLAVAQHADAIELDAKLTRDGRIVIMHDSTVDRTTNGHGAVHKMTWHDLQKLSAGGEPNDPETAVPLLADVLQTVSDDLMVNIELTNYASPTDALPDKVADLITELGIQHRVWISSFNPLTLWRFARRMPDVPIGFLIDERYPWLYRLIGRFIRHEAVEPPLSLVHAQDVAQWHQQGKRVLVYTVNQAEDMRRLFQWNVDGIYTDDPPLAEKVRASFTAAQTTEKG